MPGIVRTPDIFTGRESGTTFVETLVALALLGAIAVIFLSGLATTSRATIVANEQTTAQSLAQSQMEWVKNTTYVYEATEYATAPIPEGKDYVDYSAIIVVEPFHSSDNGVQKITVTIQHTDKQVILLEGYKVDR